MTCSKNLGRLLQASCLGLIGMLTVVGCGGSENPAHNDAAPTDGGGGGSTGAALNVSTSNVPLGSIDLGNSGTATVIVTNTGTAPSGALAVVSSTGIIATGCTGTLAAHATCNLLITATPTVLGGFNGTVSISATPGAVTPLQIAVTATVAQGGVFNVAPPTIDLGNVLVGAPAVKQTIAVSALVALTDLAVAVNGADITKDATSTCTAILAAGASCNVVVNFVAAGNGARSNSVIISAKTVTKTVPITATAQSPAKLVISPSAPTSVATTVGVPSSPIPFGVSNSGDLPTGALTVAIGGSNAADFTATPSAGCTLVAPLGTSCTITVVFNPKAASTTPEAATLTVTDTGTGASTVSVTLSGTAYPASLLTITPAASDLGTVLVGATGAVTTFTVTNGGGTASGALTVTISSTEIVKSSDTCSGASLAPAATCTIGLQLTPASAGAKTGTLTVTGTDGAPGVKTLTGTGTLPAGLTATPPTLDFGSIRVNNTSAAKTVTVTNNGGSATGALTFTKAGDFGDFPVSSNSCSAPLAPGASCTFSLAFTPTQVKSESASYTVTDGTASAVVSISGNALAATGLSVHSSPSTTVDEVSSVLACPASDFRRHASPPSSSMGRLLLAHLRFLYVVADSPLPAGATDTGAITVAISPATPSRFHDYGKWLHQPARRRHQLPD